MLTSDELKDWLHKDLERLDKLLLVLATKEAPIVVSEIAAISAKAGFRIPKKWNPSAILSASKGKAIRTSGWEITDAGKRHLRELGVSKISPAAMQVAVDLRAHLEVIGPSV